MRSPGSSIAPYTAQACITVMENVMQPTSGANTPPGLIGLQNYAAA